MNITVGIGLAFVAMLSWGFGDFLIQRSTRRLGDWETLFVITIFGSLVLLPFVYKTIPTLFVGSRNDLFILISSGLVLLCASLLDFEGFKKGKLSVLEPILSFEIPAASFLAFFILGDRISWLQIIVIVLLIIGLFMISFREKHFSKKIFLEKGVLLFFLGAAFMGLSDFLLGWGSRLTDPLIANFVLNIIMAVISGIVIVSRGQVKRLVRDITHNPVLVLVMSVSDNVAWVAYAFAMSIVPIAIATGLSESSIIIAVVLGFVVNHEKVQRHQKIGLIIAFLSALTLAIISS